MPTDVLDVSAKLNATHAMGQSVSLGAEGWLQQQQSTQHAITNHGDDIAVMKHTIKSLEQQVKAITRVMSQQNVPQLTDILKSSLLELKKEMASEINDKAEDVLRIVDKELSSISTRKGAIHKRIEEVEENVFTRLTVRLDEMAKARHELESKVEANTDLVRSLPQKFSLQVDQMNKERDIKFDDWCQKYKEMKACHELWSEEQDKSYRRFEEDARKYSEAAHNLYTDETLKLQKLLRRHESANEEKLRQLRDGLEEEHRERIDMCKGILGQAAEKLATTKRDVERAFHLHETDLAGQLRTMASGVAEIKKSLEAEHGLREAADQELARGLAMEKKERDATDERLLTSIHSCMATLSKMHKG